MTLKSIDNEYIITVENKQTADGVTDTITEVGYGKYATKNGKNYITYVVENEDDKTSIMIKTDGNETVIKRSGSVNSVMTYKIGIKDRFMYRLPYGNIEMESDTHKMVVELDDNGGTIFLAYTLDAQGTKCLNDMKITVTKR